MQRIIVIGIGNPLRGDDGIGWYTVDRLEESLESREIEFTKCVELTPEFSEKISRSKFALFIDSRVESQEAEIKEEHIVPAEVFPALETHRLDPAGILAFSRSLYGKIPEAIMLTVEGKSFEYGEEISLETEQRVESLLVRAREILNDWLQKLRIEYCIC